MGDAGAPAQFYQPDKLSCRLLPALHVHLPCTALLKSDECALIEERERNFNSVRYWV